MVMIFQKKIGLILLGKQKNAKPPVMMILDESLKQEVAENPGNEKPVNIFKDYVGKKGGLKKLQVKVGCSISTFLGIKY
jgi:hypothetical protein